jgi:hypothetical protein
MATTSTRQRFSPDRDREHGHEKDDGASTTPTAREVDPNEQLSPVQNLVILLISRIAVTWDFFGLSI